MLHFEYNWDLGPNGIKLDEELNVDRLGWEEGDYFRLEERDGRRYLRRVDPLIKFIRDAAEEKRNNDV